MQKWIYDFESVSYSNEIDFEWVNSLGNSIDLANCTPLTDIRNFLCVFREIRSMKKVLCEEIE